MALCACALGALLVSAGCSATDGNQPSDNNGSGDGSGIDGNGVDDDGFGSGDSGGFNGEACGTSTFGNEVPGSLLVILDKSGSMSDKVGGVSKWNATLQAINTMMSSAGATLEMGLLPFPAGNFDEVALLACMPPFGGGPGCDAVLADAGCTDVSDTAAVPIAPLGTNEAMISAWMGSHGPTGATPTRYALKKGYSILQSHPTSGQRYALLITDGEPSVHVQATGPFPEMRQMCGTKSDMESEVLNALNASPATATFIIGSPGSEVAASFLSQLAINGNTMKAPDCSAVAGNCHYQIGGANFQQALEDVLQTIAGQIADCVFELPSGEEVDPNLVNVVIETPDGPVEIYKDPSHQDGWDYTDGSQTHIQLHGPACELYKQQKGNTISIVLGCESVLK
ncbi:MAG: hypothetical protein VB934_12945 [Polyangiaceae bacterium]